MLDAKKLSLTDYPFTGHHCQLNGHQLHYLDEGDPQADPVIMVHGNPSWSYYYRRLVTDLSSRYRCLAPDHIGMGLSDRPTDQQYRYTLDQRVDDLTQWIDQLNLTEPIRLVVHDWGGMIGAAWALKNIDRVKQIVILNTAFGPLANNHLPWQLHLSRTPLIGSLLIRGFNAFARGTVRQGITRSPLPASIAQSYLAPYNSWANRRAVHRFVQDIPTKPTDPAYQTVQWVEQNIDRLADRPMLIGWGMRDFVFTPEFLAQWTDRFPNAATHTFDDAGHYVLEDAYDQLLPLIETFFTTPGNPKNNGSASVVLT